MSDHHQNRFAIEKRSTPLWLAIPSNQSLERTPLGLPVCIGMPCMVSLSSSRWAEYETLRTLR
jgi:hypothetical protein